MAARCYIRRCAPPVRNRVGQLHRSRQQQQQQQLSGLAVSGERNRSPVSSLCCEGSRTLTASSPARNLIISNPPSKSTSMKERRSSQKLTKNAMDNQTVKCKIVVVGDSQCGKTALLHVFAKDCFPEVCHQSGFLSLADY